MAVDVVILTWNDGPFLETAIRSALGSKGIHLGVVVVVDNGSYPSAAPAPDPRVRVARNSINRGVAPARNQGIRMTDADFVCLLDSDARLYPEALSVLLASACEAGVGLAAPVFAGQPPEASAGRAPTLRRKVARVLGFSDTYAPMPRDPGSAIWDVEFAIGACQLIRRAAFDEVGGLDESYFYGPEDVDFCLRLRAAGWRIVQVAEATVEHPPRRRFRGLQTRRGIQHAWAVVRHLWRHHPSRRYARNR